MNLLSPIVRKFWYDGKPFALFAMRWKCKREACLMLSISNHGFYSNQNLSVPACRRISFINMECCAFYQPMNKVQWTESRLVIISKRNGFKTIVCKFLLMLKVIMIFSIKKEVVINTLQSCESTLQINILFIQKECRLTLWEC